MLLRGCFGLQEVLGVLPQVDAPYYMNMAMTLALHAFSAKVGQDAESPRSQPPAHIHRYLAQSTHQPAAPHIALLHVLFGHDQEHERDPGQLIDYNYDVLIEVTYRRGRAARDDVTENAIGRSGQRRYFSIRQIHPAW